MYAGDSYLAPDIPHRGSFVRFCDADSIALERSYRYVDTRRKDSWDFTGGDLTGDEYSVVGRIGMQLILRGGKKKLLHVT